ncbi:MAG TPA: MFS transporter, partial [Caulobacter sp.]|nr:MFS transporter [Caulobacter sp.]
MIVFLLSALDQTIVATAMPRIVAQLSGLDLYPWVTTAYLLASTVMVPIYGKLSDIY